MTQEQDLELARVERKLLTLPPETLETLCVLVVSVLLARTAIHASATTICPALLTLVIFVHLVCRLAQWGVALCPDQENLLNEGSR
jgi:flagellar biosynthesis protein FliQ